MSERAPRLRVPGITAAFVALALLASFAPGLAHALRFDRNAVETGQLWRLATAHLVHEWPRLAAVDLGMFAVLGAWLELRKRSLLATSLAASAVLSSAAVWTLRSDLRFYQGASALAAGVFVALAVDLVHEGSRARVLGALMLAAWIAKTAAELLGAWPAAWSAAPPGVESVAIAHAAGGLGGAAAALLSARAAARSR